MGMYTGLRLNVILKDQIPSEVREMITYMVSGEGETYPHISHDLFWSQRWEWMLRSASSYIGGVYDDKSSIEGNHLDAVANIKNYDNEIEKFLDWLSPYVEKIEYGFYHYEEMRGDVPIHFTAGKLLIDRDHPNHQMVY